MTSRRSGPRQKRWRLHFTPTSSSWLNLLEGRLAQLTNKRLKKGVFTSVAELTEALDVWASHCDDDAQPFVWTKTAKEIITKSKRGRAEFDHITTSATHPS